MKKSLKQKILDHDKLKAQEIRAEEEQSTRYDLRRESEPVEGEEE